MSTILLERASAAASSEETYHEVLAFVRDDLDCDVASLHVAAAYPVTGSGPIASVGFDRELLQLRARRWPEYLGELEPLGLAASRCGGVISDGDVYTPADRAKKAYYKELSRPAGLLDTVVGYLYFRRKPIAALMLARRSSSFTSCARTHLQQLLPAVTLAVAAAPVRPRAWPPAARLTARERQVLDRAAAGLTNEEIASSLATSVNTVRNQVSALLRKLELDCRADLVETGLHLYRADHR